MKELRELHEMVKTLGAASPNHKKPSIFYNDIRELIENLVKCLAEEKQKWHWKWSNYHLWEERALQEEILVDAMKTVDANHYPDDMFLHFICGEILKWSHTSSWWEISVYDEFVNELRAILARTTPRQMNINTTYNLLYYKQLFETEIKRKDQIVLAELRKDETKEKPIDEKVQVALQGMRVQHATEYSALQEQVNANLRKEGKSTDVMEGVTGELLNNLSAHTEYMYLFQQEYPTVFEVMSKHPKNPLTAKKQEYTKRMVEASQHSRTSSQSDASDAESLRDSANQSPRSP